MSSVEVDSSQVPDEMHTPRMNWKKRRHWILNLMDLTWSEATELAEDRKEWYSDLKPVQRSEDGLREDLGALTTVRARQF